MTSNLLLIEPHGCVAVEGGTKVNEHPVVWILSRVMTTHTKGGQNITNIIQTIRVSDKFAIS